MGNREDFSGGFDPAHAWLIVTGASLWAERFDRPAAYELAASLRAALEAEGCAAAVLVCSDLWYLNHDALRDRPTVSVGSPGVNALTAYMADKLPSAYAVDGKLVVQADLDFDDAIAACWGATHEGTGAAVKAFTEKYLGGFVRAGLREDS